MIIRSLTILEGFALSVDPNFRLVRGAYPYVLAQLLNPDEDEKTPEALRKLLIRLLTVDGKEEEIEWERLRDFLRLAQKAQKNYNPADVEYDDRKREVSRQTIDLFFRFLTSKTGLFLKKPLVHELSEMTLHSLFSELVLVESDRFSIATKAIMICIGGKVADLFLNISSN